MTKTVHIQYFAILRDQRGLSSEDYETCAPDAGKLFAELQSKYEFSLSADRLKVAINDNFTSWDSEINNNDKIVFIPPVAGG
jgi:molybdopterin converting factor small subunit